MTFHEAKTTIWRFIVKTYVIGLLLYIDLKLHFMVKSNENIICICLYMVHGSMQSYVIMNIRHSVEFYMV